MFARLDALFTSNIRLRVCWPNLTTLFRQNKGPSVILLRPADFYVKQRAVSMFAEARRSVYFKQKPVLVFAKA